MARKAKSALVDPAENPETTAQVETVIEPATDHEPEEPATDPEPEEPAVDPEPEEPAVDPEPEEPAVDPEPEEPAVDPEPEEPAVDPEPEEPAVDPEPEEPDTDPEPEVPAASGPKKTHFAVFDIRGIIPEKKHGVFYVGDELEIYKHLMLITYCIENGLPMGLVKVQ
jgi:hypothetical protein